MILILIADAIAKRAGHGKMVRAADADLVMIQTKPGMGIEISLKKHKTGRVILGN